MTDRKLQRLQNRRLWHGETLTRFGIQYQKLQDESDRQTEGDAKRYADTAHEIGGKAGYGAKLVCLAYVHTRDKCSVFAH